MLLKSPDDTTYESTHMPDDMEPFNCCSCGCRLGWFNTGQIDDPTPSIFCDDCSAQIAQDNWLGKEKDDE